MQQRFNIKPRPPVILIGNVVLNEWRRLNPGAQVTRLDANGVPHNGYPVCEHGIIVKNVCIRCQDKRKAERSVTTQHTTSALLKTSLDAMTSSRNSWMWATWVMAAALVLMTLAYVNKPTASDCVSKPQNEVQKLMKQRSDALRTTFVF